MDAGWVLAQLCDDLEGLRYLAARRRVTAEFEGLIASARDGKPVAEHLTELLGIEIASPNEVDESRSRGPLDTRSGGEGVVGVLGADGHVTDGVYVCPRAACDREVRREAGDPVPFCGLHDRDMRYL